MRHVGPAHDFDRVVVDFKGDPFSLTPASSCHWAVESRGLRSRGIHGCAAPRSRCRRSKNAHMRARRRHRDARTVILANLKDRDRLRARRTFGWLPSIFAICSAEFESAVVLVSPCRSPCRGDLQQVRRLHLRRVAEFLVARQTSLSYSPSVAAVGSPVASGSRPVSI